MRVSLLTTLMLLAVTGLVLMAGRLRSRQTARLSVMDRRKNPREFLVAGWDPYIVSLTRTAPEEADGDDKVQFSRPGALVRRLMFALLIVASALVALKLL